MVSREFLYRFEDELTRARYEIDEAYQVSKERLEAAGFIRVINNNGHQITVGNTTETRFMTTPLDRLKGKFLQARGVAPRVMSNMEAEADSLIAEEDALKAETVSAFAPHKEILAESRNELGQIRDALKLMSNGGPSLDPLPDAENTGA